VCAAISYIYAVYLRKRTNTVAGILLTSDSTGSEGIKD